jgi:Bifunctional DNA primase/polymerase, N-terminal
MSGVSPDLIVEYQRLGWSLVPVPAGAKRPTIKDWPSRQFGPGDFPAGGNIGMLTGRRSRDVVDTDLDCEEALTLADLYLPPTGAIFGRNSKPRSHWLYTAVGATFAPFADPVAGDILLELRADGRDGGPTRPCCRHLSRMARCANGAGP